MNLALFPIVKSRSRQECGSRNSDRCGKRRVAFTASIREHRLTSWLASMRPKTNAARIDVHEKVTIRSMSTAIMRSKSGVNLIQCDRIIHFPRARFQRICIHAIHASISYIGCIDNETENIIYNLRMTLQNRFIKAYTVAVCIAQYKHQLHACFWKFRVMR
jgi:hypothetical protein